MWERTLDGRVLTFRLAGINNQNFLMRDEETGSYWQQVSGQAISGPLRGRQLAIVPSDELTLAWFTHESPAGTVLESGGDPKQYDSDWEPKVAKLPTTPLFHDATLADRDVVIGLSAPGEDRAIPYQRIREQRLIQDRLANDPVAIVLGPDDVSVRVFRARHPETGAVMELFRKAGPTWGLVDSLTGAEWDFRGCALSGPLQGKCLPALYALKDYWFDWKNYHPRTTVYAR